MPRARSSQPSPRRSGSHATTIRIVVADSQAIDRGGMVGLLDRERDFDVIGEAANLEEAIRQARSLRPDVLVLSLNLPDQSTLPAIPALRAALPGIRILALSERGESNCLVLNPPSRPRAAAEEHSACAFGTDCLQLAAAQGALGTLRRSADPEELLRAIRAVAAGHAWYDRTTANGLIETIDTPVKREPLSDRELDVAALIAEGMSNKEISTALTISEPTVKKHVGRILQKLGLADRLQAGLFLARHPLVFRRPER